MYYYSKTTGGFYRTDIHKTMPSDIVEVTDDEHKALFYDLGRGRKAIMTDANGKPFAGDIVVSSSELLNNCKNNAKRLITACDWTHCSDVDLKNKDEFTNYRKILRQYILSPVENPVFPTPPTPRWN